MNASLVLRAAIAAFIFLGGNLLCPVPLSAKGSLPSNQSHDCQNNDGGCEECPQCKCDGGGGGGGNGGGAPQGAGKGSSDQGGGNSTGQTGHAPNCADGHCNPAGGLGPPTDHPVGMQGLGFTKNSARNADAHGTKGIVNLRRTDVSLAPNGTGFPLTVARTYGSWLINYTDNLEGRTAFGPRWHFAYDMRIEADADSDDVLYRTSAGHQLILYKTGPTEWQGDELNGAPLNLVKTDTEFVLTQPDERIVYRFFLTGRLKSMRGPNGNLLTFTYDSENLLVRADMDHEDPQKDHDTRYLTFEYDTYTTFTLPAPNIPQKRLARVRTWDGRGVDYLYDSYGMLWFSLTPNWDIIEWYRNDIGRTNWGTNPFPLLVQIYAPDGEGVPRTTRCYVYDYNGFLSETRDGKGRKIFHIEYAPMGANAYHTAVVDDDGHRTEYDANFTRDPVATREYPTSGVLASTVRQQFVSGTLPDSSFGGMRPSLLPRLQVTDAGTTRTYTYLNEGLTTAGIWDKLHVMKVDEPDGAVTEYERDAKHRITAIRYSLGRVVRFTYDGEGNMTSSKDTLGRTTYMWYDDYGRLVKREDPTSGTTLLAYDTQGLVTCTTNTEGRATTTVYNSLGLPTQVTANGITNTYAYNSADLLTTITDQLGNRIVRAYDKMRRYTTVTDPLGNANRYAYDWANNLQNVVDAKNQTTTCTYDRRGNLTGFTDQRSYTTAYGYDWRNRLTSETNPLGKTWRYYYYDTSGGCSSCGASPGKIWKTRDPAGRETEFSYNSAGRLWRMTWPDNSDYVEYGYDAAGRRTSMFDTRLNIGNKTFTWGFDALDRVTTETYPDGAVVAWSYDTLGRRSTLTDPDGRVTQYAYNNTATNKQLSTITHPLSGTTYYYYDTYGRLVNEFYSNDTNNGWHYDSLGRVDWLRHRYEDSPMRWETYTYNAASMRTRVDYTSDGYFTPYHKLYSYDSLGQLTEEHKRWSGSNVSAYRYAYQFDAAGNRTQLVHYDGASTATTNYTHNAGNQIVSRTGGVNYTFDDNGNMASEESQDGYRFFEHNRDNRLVSVDTDNTVVGYVYDALGRRIERIAPDGTRTRYYYDGLNILMTREQPGGSGGWRTNQAYTLKRFPIGQVIAEHTASAWNGGGSPTEWSGQWYHFDLLGNTNLISEVTGNVFSQMEMDGYGNVLSGRQSTFGLATKNYDSDAISYYFNARWYCSEIGVFFEKSNLGPILEHSYSFCNSVPTVFVDPTGLLPLDLTVDNDESTIRTKNRGYASQQSLARINAPLNNCPSTRPQCPGSGFCSEGQGNSTTFHPGADECFREVVNPRSPILTGGSQCCYDSSGNLIPSGLGAGTYDIVATAIGVNPQGSCVSSSIRAVAHFAADVLTWVH